ARAPTRRHKQSRQRRRLAQKRAVRAPRKLTCVAGCNRTRAPVAVGSATFVQASAFPVGYTTDRIYPTGIRCSAHGGCSSPCYHRACPTGPLAIRRRREFHLYVYQR
ncbi:MAG: hypothetical protein AAGG99_09570, partial [Pseudomonadota bacterium]